MKVTALVLALAWMAVPGTALSVFMRTPWLNDVPEVQWRSWFELVKRGRLEGRIYCCIYFYCQSIVVLPTG